MRNRNNCLYMHPIRFGFGSQSSACGSRAQFCLGTYWRSTSKASLLPSSLYTRKRCSSHRIFFLAFEQVCSCSSSPEHLSSSLLLSLSLPLPLSSRLLSSSLLSCWCSCDEALLTLWCKGRACVALFLIEHVSVSVNKFVLPDATGMRLADRRHSRGGNDVLAGGHPSCWSFL
jgi:hypothetical protein